MYWGAGNGCLGLISRPSFNASVRLFSPSLELPWLLFVTSSHASVPLWILNAFTVSSASMNFSAFSMNSCKVLGGSRAIACINWPCDHIYSQERRGPCFHLVLLSVFPYWIETGIPWGFLLPSFCLTVKRRRKASCKAFELAYELLDNSLKELIDPGWKLLNQCRADPF